VVGVSPIKECHCLSRVFALKKPDAILQRLQRELGRGLNTLTPLPTFVLLLKGKHPHRGMTKCRRPRNCFR